MYTVIYFREKSDNDGDDLCNIRSFPHKADALKYLQTSSYHEERMRDEDRRYNNRRYFYGEYSFLVLKDGYTVYESSNFNSIAFNMEIPPYHPDDDDRTEFDGYNAMRIGYMHQVEMGVRYDMILTEETAYSESLTQYRREKKMKEEEDKERKLLEELLKKYPDMK